MNTTQQNFVNKPNLLAINHFLEAFFVPFYPILADFCQVSIPMVKQTMPVMLDIIACQILKQITPSQTQTFQPLSGFLQDDRLANTAIQNMQSFYHLKQIEVYKNQMFDEMFSKTQLPMIIGYVLAKTQLPKAKIQTLLAWTTFLALKVLHDFCSTKREFSLTEKQLTYWRDYQFVALVKPETAQILDLIDFKIKFSVSTYQKQSENLLQQPQMQEVLQNIDAFFDVYTLAKSKVLQENIDKNQSHSTKIVQDDMNIFAPLDTKKRSWLDYLQKYWVATSMVLSAVVFGLMNFIMPVSKQENKNMTRATITSPTQINQEKKVYHDVAIVKISSTPSEEFLNNDDEKKEVAQPAKTVEKTSKKPEKKAKDTTKKPDDKKVTDKKVTDKKSVKDKSIKEDKKLDKKVKETKLSKEDKSSKKTTEKSSKAKQKVSDKTKKPEVKKKVRPQSERTNNTSVGGVDYDED